MIERKRELDFLVNAAKNKKNAVLLGPSYSGKTTILKSFIEKNKDISVYCNLSFIGITPEELALQIIARTAHAIHKKDAFEKYLDFEFLQTLQLGKASDSIRTIVNELQKIKPDQKLMLETAWRFPSIVAQQEKKHIVVVIDEFHELLDLNNYDQVKDIGSIIAQKHPSVSYIFSGMSLPGTETLISDFERATVQPLTIEETKTLTKLSDAEVNKLYTCTNGNPYLTTMLLKRYSQSIEKTLQQEKEFISLYCSHIYTDLLSRSRGRTLLMNIMQVLSLHTGLRLSELSRKIYRQAPVTKSLLTRLLDVGLIEAKQGVYDITDKTMKQWLAQIAKGEQP